MSLSPLVVRIRQVLIAVVGVFAYGLQLLKLVYLLARCHVAFLDDATDEFVVIGCFGGFRGIRFGVGVDIGVGVGGCGGDHFHAEEEVDG